MREGVSGKLNHLAVFEYFRLLELSSAEQLDLLRKFKSIEEVVLKRRDELAEKERKKQEREAEKRTKQNGRAFNPRSRFKR